jgi:hypothetical protein
MRRCEAPLSQYCKGNPMENTEVTNPATEEAAAPAPAPEVTNDEPDELLSADADESAVEPEEFIDIEKDGKTYKVPKSVEDLLMFQKDYTQKTQTLAEQRRELESQRQATEWEAQTRAELFQEEAQLFNVSQRLQQFQGVNWQALAQQDMQQYAVLQAEYTQLRDFADRLHGTVEGLKSELAAKREQDAQSSLHRAVEHLSKARPELGWDGKFDADKRASLTKFGIELGFTNEELSNTSHPLMIQTLNLARIGMEALKKQSATLKAQPQAIPVPNVSTGKTRTAPSNPDKLPMNDWLKWREGQIRKNRSS